jgi:hypothetical protein
MKNQQVVVIAMLAAGFSMFLGGRHLARKLAAGEPARLPATVVTWQGVALYAATLASWAGLALAVFSAFLLFT